MNPSPGPIGVRRSRRPRSSSPRGHKRRRVLLGRHRPGRSACWPRHGHRARTNRGERTSATPRGRPRPRPRTPGGAARPARSGPRRGSPTLPPAGRRTRRPGHGIDAARRPGSSGTGRRAGADGGSRTSRDRRVRSSTKLSTSSWSGSSRAPGGRSMIPARTPGLNERPMIAPAPAAAWASGERCAILARTASSMVSGTVASRIAALRSGVRAQCAQKLLDVEGDAVRPLIDGVRDLTRRRQTGIEDQRRDERGLGCGQAGRGAAPRPSAG